MLCLHNKVVGIGYFGRPFDVVGCGLLCTKLNIVGKGVIEEDGFLIDIANELAQIVHPKVFHIDAIDEHFALLHVIITRDKVDKGRLSRAALPHQGYHFPLRNDEINIA